MLSKPISKVRNLRCFSLIYKFVFFIDFELHYGYKIFGVYNFKAQEQFQDFKHFLKAKQINTTKFKYFSILLNHVDIHVHSTVKELDN